MSEIVINTNTLPEPLISMITSDRVVVRETGGEIRLIPVPMPKYTCPLRGIASDSKLTVDRFLSMTHDEKEMEP